MNTKKILTDRAVSISTRFFRGWRHMLPGAALAGAMAAASPALAMGDGLSPGLFLLSVGDRALLACDTDESFALNGCNAAVGGSGGARTIQGVQYLAVPPEHEGDVFWNNGRTIEQGVAVEGMQEIGIVGKEQVGTSFDEVCVTVDVRTGPARDRGKLVCVEIFPGPDTSPPSCGTAVPVVSDSAALCTEVQDELDRGYVINRLGYVIDVDLPFVGEAGKTRIVKCAGFTHRCTPVRDNVTVKGSRHTALVETPHYTGGYITCKTC